MRSDKKLRFTQNIKTDKSILQYGQFSVIIFARLILTPIYDIQKKLKNFKWTDEAEKAFNDIKKFLVNPPVLKAPIPDGLFRLESDTS